MKGFQEVEFIISVFVFITTISFVTIVIINNIPLFYNIALTENLKAKSFQFSEILLFDEGYPKNWNSMQLSGINRIGLSVGQNYFIDKQKIDKLSEFCSLPNNYKIVKSKLGIATERDIIIQVSYIDGSAVSTSIDVCKPSVTSRIRQQFQTTRFGLLNTANNPIIRIKFTMIN